MNRSKYNTEANILITDAATNTDDPPIAWVYCLWLLSLNFTGLCLTRIIPISDPFELQTPAPLDPFADPLDPMYRISSSNLPVTLPRPRDKLCFAFSMLDNPN